MHELAICQALVVMVNDIAAAQAALPQVVTVQIGPLAGVEPGLLARAYPLAAAGSPAASARLEIAHVALRVRCKICEAVSEAIVNQQLCALCGAWQTKVISGDELLLKRVAFFPQTQVGAHV
jgi:hydrogenase nickel incorporation protein HypA/HybF